MVTVSPIPKALLPKDSPSAAALSSPNYDEFQDDAEIRLFLERCPESILGLKMPHCSVSSEEAPAEGSPEALALAARKMQQLKSSARVRTVSDLLYVYEITDPRRPHVPQIGLGCFGKTSEILTEQTPDGVIIRNEGIREKKAHGRADLIKATKSFIGVVNNAVEDRQGSVLEALRAHAASTSADYEIVDERGNKHRVWLVTSPQAQQRFISLYAQEPYAYVADGNHRSAAAAMLGYDNFLTVFFPAAVMGIRPYNRLVKAQELSPQDLSAELSPSFKMQELGPIPGYQPEQTHHIGLYTKGRWFELQPKPRTYDPANAVESIDSDIVQRCLFAPLFGIEDARDDRLTFVGSNKDVDYLMQQVNSGLFEYALTLPPVTMDQFIEVCRQRRMMPPKSTWFESKIRSGLVVALLD